MLRGWIAMPTVVVDATVIRLRPRLLVVGFVEGVSAD
jgi:hypothetical protein